MTPEEFVAKVQKIIAAEEDFEFPERKHEPTHEETDALMMQVLADLGYQDGINLIAGRERFYADRWQT